MLRAIAVLCCFVASGISASAADICKAIALRDVPAIEAPDSILEKGQYDTAVTQLRVDKKTGRESFCSHGGYCYPTHLIVGGQKVEVLRLVNCAVNKSKPYVDADETTFGVDVIRSKVSRSELRYDDLDNKFLEMGLCSACASNVAGQYLSKPNSRCSKLARRALEGDPGAAKTLQNGPNYCN